jgi:hypothetical protein
MGLSEAQIEGISVAGAWHDMGKINGPAGRVRLRGAWPDRGVPPERTEIPENVDGYSRAEARFGAVSHRQAIFPLTSAPIFKTKTERAGITQR